MAGGQAHLILQYLRNLIHRRGGEGVADRALLERFVRQRDEAAFEVLVWRHGPMVLALGQRMLHNPHDAEDVLQATFLTLVRKAGSIGNSESLSSWLYKVAYRIALHARARAAKMRTADRPIEDVPAGDESEEAVWRELRPLLDAAIERLPEKYRSAIVLCDLQGKTYREAAEQLGCAVGTISTRVTRARQMLRKHLAHHGLSVSLGALSAALAQRTTAALPASLAAATLRAAVRLVSNGGAAGIVSASVAELMEGANQAMLMSRFKIVMLLTLAAGAAAVGVASRAALRHEPPPPQKDPPHAEAAKAPADAVTVRGLVLGPDGKPVKGARLYWPRLPKSRTEDFDSLAFPQRARSDTEGRFRFEIPRADLHPGWHLHLVAAADGYGVSWSESSAVKAGGEVTLRLVKDHPIQGRILNAEGQPLAGVRVRAVAVSKLPHPRLDDFLTAWERDWRRVFQQISGPFLSAGEKSFLAVTDKDGRFRLSGVGVERVILLRVRGSGVAEEILYVFNRAGFDAAPVNKAARAQHGAMAQLRLPGQPPLLSGPTVHLQAKGGRRIEGTVREAGSGKGVAGYRVYLRDGFGFRIQADSDERGRYQICGVPPSKRYRIFAKPPANSAWLSAVAGVKDEEGSPAVHVDFTVARGILVRGRVLDRATGKGVAGGLRFVPLPGNTFFDKPGYDSYKDERLARPTDTDGRFQLAVLAGTGVLLFQAESGEEKANGGQLVNPFKQAEFAAKDHEQVKITERNGRRCFVTAIPNALESLENANAVKVLDLAPDAGTAKCDLFVERGAKRTLQIEDADGEPLKGTTVAGVTAMWPTTFTIKDATCTIFALDPKKPRRLFFLHAKRHLAGTLTLRGDEKEPVVMRLKPTGSVIGRLLDRDGQPITLADVSLILADQTGLELYRVAQQQLKIRTGKDGRFRLEGIVPEVKFTLDIGKGKDQQFIGEPRIGVKQVKPGETLDLGDVRVKPAK